MNREILKLAIPNVLTNLTVPLVSLVDIGLMGHMPTKGHIISIGLAVVIFNIIYWAFGFLRMGTTGLVAQKFGQDNKTATLIFLKRGLMIAIGGGALLILLSKLIFNSSMLLLQVEPALQELISDYFFIRIHAAPFTISIFVLTGWLLGMQDAKAALFIAIVVNVVNVILSALLVLYYELDITGVAYGTVVAQIIGCIFAWQLIKKKYQVNILSFGKLQSSNNLSWLDYIRINADIFVRTICLLAVLSFFKVQAAQLNETLGAANLLLLEFITISAYGIDGFAFAAESISGKYFGLGDKISFKQSIKKLMHWGIGIGSVFSIIFLLFGQHILALLTNKQDVIAMANIYMPWLIIAPIINAFAFIWDGIYLGVSATKLMRNTMLISTVLFFLFYSILVGRLNNHGIWLSLTLFMLARGIFQTLPAKKFIIGRLD